MKYILASASPRRKELLIQAGMEFGILTSGIEEKTEKTTPSDIVMELAGRKALSVWDKLNIKKDYTVIGADTVVVYKNEILGKPADEEEAFDMLSMLADRTHTVYTGVALVSDSFGTPKVRSFYEGTQVTLYPISREDLKAYISTGDCLDKAGGYGIQGAFAVHVKCICGDYCNVVGLPIGRLYQELKSLAPQEGRLL